VYKVKKVISYLILTILSSLSFADYLKNSEFKEFTTDNIPKSWSRRGEKENFKYIKNGFVHMKNSSKPLFHIQVFKAKPFIAGKIYKVSYEVKSPYRNPYRCYFEYTQDVNGKQKRTAEHTSFSAAPEKWWCESFSFEFKKNVLSCQLVINTLSKHEVAFRNLKIEEVKNNKIKHISGGFFDTINPGANSVKVSQSGIILDVRRNNIRPGVWLKEVPLIPGKNYELSYKVKGYGDSGNNIGFHSYGVTVSFGDIKTEKNAPWDDVWNASFQQKNFIFKVPLNAKNEKINIGFQCNSKGGIIFKDIKINEALLPESEKVKIVLDSPFYRKMIFASDPVNAIKGYIKFISKLEADKVKIILSRDGKIITSKIQPCQNGFDRFSLPADKLETGCYDLCFEFLSEGKKTASKSLVIEKLKHVDNEVVIKKDRKFYINGHIFYPVVNVQGISRGMEAYQQSLYYASRKGINTIIAGSGTKNANLAILNNAHKFGMKVFLRAGITSLTDQDNFIKWQRKLEESLGDKEVRQHPALLGYFLYDEPMAVGISFKRLILSYNALKKMDPYHPVWINAAPRGNVGGHAKYSQAADIYGLDIYPVPYPGFHSGMSDKRLTCVGKYTEMMNKSVDYRKPLIMILQAFAWNDLRNNKREAFYPTLIELRFMTYDAIVNGTTGIALWGTDYILKKSFYDTMFKVTDELNRMSGLLTKGRKIKGFSSDNNKIVCYALECDGKKYLIALNASHEKQNCVIKTAFDGNECIELYENCKVKLSNSAIKTSFIPYGVNIYGEAELPPPAVKKPEIFPEMEKKGNPFHNYLDNLKNIKYYQGNASWIWDNKTWNLARSKTIVGKNFEVEGKVSKATLFFAIDDMGAAYINGKKIADALGWSAVKALDCTELVKQGKNSLVVSAADAGHLPCGILVELRIVFDSGKTMTVISDSSWLGNENADVKQPAAGNLGAWNKVKVIAPYGSGAWKSNVRMVK
jgi:hypothetical protein